VRSANLKNIVVLLLTAVLSGQLNGQISAGHTRVGTSMEFANRKISFNALHRDSINRGPDAGAPTVGAPTVNRVPALLPFSTFPVSAKILQTGKVSDNFYVKNFGFFCRKEWQLEKKTKLPVRIRVGSLEQCNLLEQKY
jgi:hypothetical protein